jgi:ribonuclease-3
MSEIWILDSGIDLAFGFWHSVLRNVDFGNFEKKLGIRFRNQDLLKQALTHRSYLNEHPEWLLGHNERLEFLGDAVIELAVTEYLFLTYENPEGELTAFRSALVNAERLAKVSRALNVDEFLLLSKGEAKEFGRSRDEILANTFEAIVGAIYLDRGYDAAQKFLARVLFPEMKEILEKNLWRDPKSAFQEKAQELVGITPAYETVREWGPDHAKRFLVAVLLGTEEVARGEGMSKQEAERKAAEEALRRKGW